MPTTGAMASYFDVFAGCILLEKGKKWKIKSTDKVENRIEKETRNCFHHALDVLFRDF